MDEICAMLEELPPTLVVWRTISHPWTAEELISEINNETPIAKQYVSDLLRINRDMLARKAAR